MLLSCTAKMISMQGVYMGERKFLPVGFLNLFLA